MTWLVKRKHYGGGESVIDRAASKVDAANIADQWNTPYQTDNYVIEQFDPAKVDWPSEERIQEIIRGVER